MIGKSSIKTVLSPALAAGVYSMTFGGFEKVTDAIVYFDNPFKAGFLFHAKTAITTNVVAVTIEKEATPGGGAWVVAVSPGGTADMVGKKLTLLAVGE